MKILKFNNEISGKHTHLFVRRQQGTACRIIQVNFDSAQRDSSVKKLVDFGLAHFDNFAKFLRKYLFCAL